MPTEKPRVTITISEDQLKQVEDYRFDNKMRNQTQAILSLVRKGLDSMINVDSLHQNIEKAPGISPEGRYDDINDLLDKLSAEQVAEVRGYIKHMVHENEAAQAAKQINGHLA